MTSGRKEFSLLELNAFVRDPVHRVGEDVMGFDARILTSGS